MPQTTDRRERPGSSSCGVAALARLHKQVIFWLGLAATALGAVVAAYDGTQIIQMVKELNAEDESAGVAELGIGIVLVALAVLPASAGLLVAWRAGPPSRG